MENLNLELTPGQAVELLKAIALRVEQAKHHLVESELKKVAKKIEDYTKENGGLVTLESFRYPIKRVTLTLYDVNPKKKPE